MTSPVFVLSLPRSGSTLLQRLLASHQEVATGPEPTFLLPILSLTSESGVLATYDHRYTSQAVVDFFASIGPSAFDEVVREWAEVAYRRSSDGERYFLDKTPKYHLVARSLVRAFPDAPTFILWRNPLAVIASILDTWAAGRWNLQHFRIDLYEGLPALIELAGDDRFPVHTVGYESLVADPSIEMGRIFDTLGLAPDETVLERFGALELPGRIQDPNVADAAFHSVRDDRVDRWKRVLGNPLRRRWCDRYLRWLGSDRLEVMGYDLDALRGELDDLEGSRAFVASDLVRMPYDLVYRVAEGEVVRRRLVDLRHRRRVYAHK